MARNSPELQDEVVFSIAVAVDKPVDEVRSWVRSNCELWYREFTSEPIVPGQPVSGTTSVSEPYDEHTVLAVVEAVLVTRPPDSLSTIACETSLSDFHLGALCARALALKFDVDENITARGLEVLGISSNGIYAGASRLRENGEMEFSSGQEKRNARSLLRAIRSAGQEVGGKLASFADQVDEKTGVPVLVPRLSRNPWLDRLPLDELKSLVRWVNSPEFEALEASIENATTASHRELKRNAAILARWIWELSELPVSVRNDGLDSPFMDFASTLGGLYGLKVARSTLLETLNAQELAGVAVNVHLDRGDLKPGQDAPVDQASSQRR
jgi:hypothetical protein